ncbi:hypothetical protein F5Y09DRAFT_357074 [Xylaria sp. FL1042]|nr:hypothetical protein F5Y09DRAFT_357074 [Xylaria sp. FL1042]
MSSPGKNIKKPRRVSFVELNSPNTAKPLSTPPPSSTPKPAINNKNSDSTRPNPPARSPPRNTCPPPKAPEPDRLASLFSHTVTNTPQGLVIDGVLRPRGPTVHSDLRDQPPKSHPFLNYPPYFNNAAQPLQVNMSTVGAGLMPDPNAVHYQPPVPDTTNGPFQYTYVPRSDPQYMMANGVAAAGPPGVFAAGPYPYQQVQPQQVLPAYTPAAPGMCRVAFTNASELRECMSAQGVLSSDAQPGMTTAPIPMMMAPGAQMPPMQAPYMQAPAVNFPPAFGYPAMNCAAAPNGPAFVATGIAQPTPPMAPQGFPGGGMGGFEMGKTKAEVEAENQYNSLHNQMNEPQGMKPADDDGSRMYWCRELDEYWSVHEASIVAPGDDLGDIHMGEPSQEQDEAAFNLPNAGEELPNSLDAMIDDAPLTEGFSLAHGFSLPAIGERIPDITLDVASSGTHPNDDSSRP